MYILYLHIVDVLSGAKGVKERKTKNEKEGKGRKHVHFHLERTLFPPPPSISSSKGAITL
jgi:hypothetical protein